MIAAALREQGAEVPADLLPVPVWASAAAYRRAFGVLSAARKRDGGDPLPIEYSEIVKFAEANGFADTIAELDEFVGLIQAQDGVFVAEAIAAATRKAGLK